MNLLDDIGRDDGRRLLTKLDLYTNHVDRCEACRKNLSKKERSGE